MTPNDRPTGWLAAAYDLYVLDTDGQWRACYQGSVVLSNVWTSSFGVGGAQSCGRAAGRPYYVVGTAFYWDTLGGNVWRVATAVTGNHTF